MAQLVLVHGVATRSGPALTASEANTRELFASSVFRAVPFGFRAPRWGDLVPAIPPAVYATDADAESFAVLGQSQDEEFGIGQAEPTLPSAIGIGEVASSRPTLAIDAVLAAIVDEAGSQDRQLTPEELALFVRAVDLVDDPGMTAGVAQAAGSDTKLAAALMSEGDDSYGVEVGPLGRAIGRVTDRIRNLTSGFAYGLVRNSIRPAVGLFSGDVFAYLNNGDLRTRIRAAVRAEIVSAWNARRPDEPLLLVGHSMGGVILTDMLADPARADLPADLTIDCLCTVGSQPGLFQAVGALQGGAPAGGLRLPRRDRIRHWFNVFDPIDPLAFAAAPIFEGVEDFAFDSITGVASAHTTYFARPQFYARFRKRLGELNLLR